MYSWFLYALFGSCHGIQLNQDRNQNQLEIKINTWFLFESIPKPIPKLHPNLSQYQNQGSKSKVRIQYQYWSRNQPVSPIPAMYHVLPPLGNDSANAYKVIKLKPIKSDFHKTVQEICSFQRKYFLPSEKKRQGLQILILLHFSVKSTIFRFLKSIHQSMMI